MIRLSFVNGLKKPVFGKLKKIAFFDTSDAIEHLLAIIILQ